MRTGLCGGWGEMERCRLVCSRLGRCKALMNSCSNEIHGQRVMWCKRGELHSVFPRNIIGTKLGLRGQ